MRQPDRSDSEQRVLVLAPTGRDAANSVALLGRAGIECAACRDMDELRREMESGVAVVLLTEESLAVDRAGALAEVLAHQPAWSDLPIIILTRGGPESPVANKAMETLGNVILLERPVRVFTLVSAVRTALRARGKQYELRAQMTQLRQADARKDQFLATLAHELRNPLAPVRTGLSVLKLAPPGPAAARAREMMERQIAHMVRLLDDLLDVSRISRGKVELRRERIELRTVVENALETCRPVVEAAHHNLTVTLPAAPVWIHGDLTRLAQVVANVLINAAKYTPDGGRIRLVGRREDDQVLISVTDNGAGIPPEMQDHVFEMFAQVHSASDRTQGGLGIGLALVKSLIEMHDGSIEVESPGAGHGSTFTVRLPVADELPAQHPPRPQRPARAPTTRLRVLVVDDNVDGAEMLATMLELAGHETRTANDGPEGLAVAREFLPEVIFLDIGLPGMDGYEVAEKLHADAQLGRAVLVALTGWGSEDDKQRSKRAGFAYHLTKPVEGETVTSLLGLLLSHARSS